MDREAVNAYVRQRHEVDAAAELREQAAQSVPAEMTRDVFHQRFGALIDRFSQLPLEDEENNTYRSFTLDIPESETGAADGGRMRLTHLDWGYEAFSASLIDPVSLQSIKEEKLFVDRRQEQKDTYDVDAVRQLFRLEQTMAVIEDELSRQPEQTAS